MQTDNLLGKLTPYKGSRVLVKQYQDTFDIIGEILSAHNKYAAEYDKISDSFLKSSPGATARAIFKFLKDNVAYKIESDAAQSVQSPAAILARGHGDCKHYASFGAGILASLKRKGHNVGTPIFRFASYSLFNKQPQHVFCVVQLGNGSELWLDPVLPTFDERKQYTYKTDRAAMLYHISGIDGIEGIGGDGLGKFRPGRFFLKVAASPSRNAFLLLLKLNVFNLAYKINQQIKRGKGEKYKNFWEKAGGNYKQFLKDVERGAKIRAKKLQRRGNAIHGVLGDEMGVIQAAVALAAATPLIAIVVKLLKGDGVEVDDVQHAVSDGAAAVSGIGDTIAGLCSIGANQARKAARKAKKAGKKAARVAKRQTRKATRQAKRAARKAKKSGGDAVDISSTTDAQGKETVSINPATNPVADVLHAGVNAYNAATGGGYSGGGYSGGDAGAGADSAGTGGAAAGAEDVLNAGGNGGGGMDSKTMLLIGGGALALLLLSKRGR